jgi:hypothetical protein
MVAAGPFETLASFYEDFRAVKLVYGRCPVWISATESWLYGYSWFSLAPPCKCWDMTRSCHNRFFPNPFQFISLQIILPFDGIQFSHWLHRTIAYNPKDSSFHIHRRENLESDIYNP